MSTWDAAGYDARHGYVARFGTSLVDDLDPLAGERILDLGCGTGHLTAEIARRGAEVLGIDRSEEMIAEARQLYPNLNFQVADAAMFKPDGMFDAVFSNAVLHWIHSPEEVVRRIATALRHGGRFVAELGGAGNIAAVLKATQRNIWYFPSIGEYASLLENHSLETIWAALFDRPTPVTGEGGLRDWLAMFYKPPLDEDVVSRAEEELRPKLFREGTWYLDYRRLRIIAKKL